MLYRIELEKWVKKFLLKHQDIARRFYSKLEVLREKPFENNLDIKALSGKKYHYRLRIWKYRFLYEIRETEILIYFYDADSRGDVYKSM